MPKCVTLRQQFVNVRHEIWQLFPKSKVLLYFSYFCAHSHMICIKYLTFGGPRRSATKFPGAARGVREHKRAGLPLTATGNLVKRRQGPPGADPKPSGGLFLRVLSSCKVIGS